MTENKSSFHNLCSSCHRKPCCIGFSAPLVFNTDIQRLKSTGKNEHDIVEESKLDGIEFKRLKRKLNSEVCIFFDEHNNQCTIYNHKPFDCEMFPFDIVWHEGSYHWLVYSCNPQSNWNWCESHLRKLESDPRFDELMQNSEILSHTTDNYISESKEPSWIILRKVNIKPQKSALI